MKVNVFNKAVKTPQALVEEALAGFNQAVQKMNEATSQIDEKIAEDEAEVARLQAKLDDAANAKDRLSRVSEKLKEFLA